jgi:hypothetical protein
MFYIQFFINSINKNGKKMIFNAKIEIFSIINNYNNNYNFIRLTVLSDNI